MRKLIVLAVLSLSLHHQPLLAAQPWTGVPGEFERQQFVVLNWSDESSQFLDTYSEIIQAATENSEVLLLVQHVRQYFFARNALLQSGVNLRKVNFVLTPFDTIWIRDYGPILTRGRDGTTVVVDADYEPPERFRDDAVPNCIGEVLGIPVVRAPITLDGGAILSNGKGLCLVSKMILQQNEHRGYDEEDIRTVLKEYYGFTQVEFVAPLEDEPTGHLDMFATFVSPDTIVVGAYDPGVDERNAFLLDDTADQLSQLQTALGPMKVVRLPMPSNEDGCWRTYTNAVFLNQVLLVPSYPSCNRAVERIAIESYRQLLPNWKVKPVPCDDLIHLGGGIHCVSMNIADISNDGQVTPLKLSTGRVLAHSWRNLWRADPFLTNQPNFFDSDEEMGMPDPDHEFPLLFDLPHLIP